MSQTIGELATVEVRTMTAPSAEEAVSTPTVVLDSSGEAWKVIVGGIGYPAVVLARGTLLTDVSANQALLRTVVRTVPGVVVVDDGRVAGFVPREQLIDLLVMGGRVRNDLGSDPLLHGEPRTVSGAVRVRCRTCRTINSYDFYLPGDEKPCEQGHPLDPDLD
ncbi:hypothetical protein [Streptomyces azureus]|uniref:CBS domain-containing protein n=1 Tax=Streptomyces azureus TaxID=146537 RepID=A0A0K8PR62_STRAJ|nr:hypothetical protein [Streptomyces azureus]GAP49899.1 putative uncharacterized protein [Streptomyces azureus]